MNALSVLWLQSLLVCHFSFYLVCVFIFTAQFYVVEFIVILLWLLSFESLLGEVSTLLDFTATGSCFLLGLTRFRFFTFTFLSHLDFFQVYGVKKTQFYQLHVALRAVIKKLIVPCAWARCLCPLGCPASHMPATCRWWEVL
jgi:hypothetical protein